MSCILRAAGADFDVDAFLIDCSLEPITVYYKGAPRYPGGRPDGPKLSRSGVHFEVSGADFSEVELQIEEALAFTRAHQGLLSALKAYPGVERVTMDFGAERYPRQWCTFYFPSDLLLAVGSLGIAIELSVYPRYEDESHEDVNG
jgi:hypothetical protein